MYICVKVTQSHNFQITEIETKLKAVIRSMNKSSAYVHQLNEILSKYRERELKNISTSRASLLP